ncbi:MAG: rhodanese-like domain-containing protein [Pseudomonadota bacterium]
MKTLFTLTLIFRGLFGWAAEVQELTSQQVFQQMSSFRVIDVRTSEEFLAEEGHIEGANLVTLGPKLTEFLKTGDRKERIVFVCRSGKRSYKAAEESMNLGYEATYSMKGGMVDWVSQGLPTTQN